MLRDYSRGIRTKRIDNYTGITISYFQDPALSSLQEAYTCRHCSPEKAKTILKTSSFFFRCSNFSVLPSLNWHSQKCVTCFDREVRPSPFFISTMSSNLWRHTSFLGTLRMKRTSCLVNTTLPAVLRHLQLAVRRSMSVSFEMSALSGGTPLDETGRCWMQSF